ncbi:UNKNOWN [Stylonychia lemnae]|uniref:Serine/threonine-protein phosphatase 4 regulatory subunit 3-like central domain-containing protein n=1 Tax=Stylonychia lemnae TaxID=5949 RepID=A0A078AAC3_STYLE|nr:UNKNOWN [Stylonychia lemnae]|eukprot:CDW79139.1 UNKNOWN [Stylonychia lemnae]
MKDQNFQANPNQDQATESIQDQILREQNFEQLKLNSLKFAKEDKNNGAKTEDSSSDNDNNESDSSDDNEESDSDSEDEEGHTKIQKCLKKGQVLESFELAKQIKKQKMLKQQMTQQIYQQFNKPLDKPQNSLMYQDFDLNDVIEQMNQGYGEDYDEDDDDENNNEYKSMSLKKLTFRPYDSSDSGDSEDETQNNRKSSNNNSSSNSSNEDDDEEEKDPEKLLQNQVLKRKQFMKDQQNMIKIQQDQQRQNNNNINNNNKQFQPQQYTNKIELKGKFGLGCGYTDLMNDEDEDDDDDEDDCIDYKAHLEDDDEENEEDLMNQYIGGGDRYSLGRNQIMTRSQNVGAMAGLRSMNGIVQKKQEPSDVIQTPDLKLDNLEYYLLKLGTCLNPAPYDNQRRQVIIKIQERNFKFIQDLGQFLEILDEKNKNELALKEAQQRQQEELKLKEKNEQQQIECDQMAIDESNKQIDVSKIPIKSAFDNNEEQPISCNEEQAISLTQQRLNNVSGIYKLLLKLEDQNILEALMTNRFYLQTFRAVELIPEYRDLKCVDYMKIAKYRQIIDISSPYIEKKIPILFRLNYLKEHIFAKEDVNQLRTLNKLILDYSQAILNHVLTKNDLLKQLLESFQRPDKTLQDHVDVASFIFELINRCKQPQSQIRVGTIQESLIRKNNSMCFIKYALQTDPRMKRKAIELGLLKEEVQIQFQLQNTQETFQTIQVELQYEQTKQINGEDNFKNENKINEDTEMKDECDIQAKVGQNIDSQQISENMVLTETSKQSQIESQNQQQELPCSFECPPDNLDELKNNIINEEIQIDQQSETNQSIDSKLEVNRSQEQQNIDSNSLGEVQDNILVTVLDYLYFLQQMLFKDVILYFLQDSEISQILSLHFFITENEGIRLQIIETFKQIIDGTSSETQQQQVEKMLKNSLFKLFLVIIKTKDVNQYSQAIQYVFEFLQYICKPTIQQLQQAIPTSFGTSEYRRERKSNTIIMRNFILEEKLTALALGFISDVKVNKYIRLMCVKFIKSLLNSEDISFYQNINKHDVMQSILRGLEEAKEKKKAQYNMLESTIFELINLYAKKILEKDLDSKEFTNFVKENQAKLAWNKGLFKMFFDDNLHLKLKNLGRTRATTQAITNQITNKYNQTLKKRVETQLLRRQANNLGVVLPAQKRSQSVESERRTFTFEDLIKRDYQDNEEEFKNLICRVGTKRSSSVANFIQNGNLKSFNSDSISKGTLQDNEVDDDEEIDMEELIQRKRQKIEQSHFKFASTVIGNGQKLGSIIGQIQNFKTSPTKIEDQNSFTWDDDEEMESDSCQSLNGNLNQLSINNKNSKNTSPAKGPSPIKTLLQNSESQKNHSDIMSFFFSSNNEQTENNKMQSGDINSSSEINKISQNLDKIIEEIQTEIQASEISKDALDIQQPSQQLQQLEFNSENKINIIELSAISSSNNNLDIVKSNT